MNPDGTEQCSFSAVNYIITKPFQDSLVSYSMVFTYIGYACFCVTLMDLMFRISLVEGGVESCLPELKMKMIVTTDLLTFGIVIYSTYAVEKKRLVTRRRLNLGTFIIMTHFIIE